MADEFKDVRGGYKAGDWRRGYPVRAKDLRPEPVRPPRPAPPPPDYEWIQRQLAMQQEAIKASQEARENAKLAKKIGRGAKTVKKYAKRLPKWTVPSLLGGVGVGLAGDYAADKAAEIYAEHDAAAKKAQLDAIATKARIRREGPGRALYEKRFRAPLARPE